MDTQKEAPAATEASIPTNKPLFSKYTPFTPQNKVVVMRDLILMREIMDSLTKKGSKVYTLLEEEMLDKGFTVHEFEKALQILIDDRHQAQPLFYDEAIELLAVLTPQEINNLLAGGDVCKP